MKTFSALLVICVGNSPITGEFPAQRPVTRSFDVFFDLRLNERLSKQSWGWWFETASRPLWRHSNGSSLCLQMCYQLTVLGYRRKQCWPQFGHVLVEFSLAIIDFRQLSVEQTASFTMVITIFRGTSGVWLTSLLCFYLFAWTRGFMRSPRIYQNINHVTTEWGGDWLAFTGGTLYYTMPFFKILIKVNP